MGQEQSIIGQRIRPTPGTSGVRVHKRNTVSLYSEDTHTITSVKVDFRMKASDLKALLPGENIQLVLGNEPLDDTLTLAELGLTIHSLVKIRSSQSTMESSIEDNARGPHICKLNKPVKPANQTTSLDESGQLDLDLSSWAVPDIRLKAQT